MLRKAVLTTERTMALCEKLAWSQLSLVIERRFVWRHCAVSVIKILIIDIIVLLTILPYSLQN